MSKKKRNHTVIAMLLAAILSPMNTFGSQKSPYQNPHGEEITTYRQNVQININISVNKHSDTD